MANEKEWEELTDAERRQILHRVLWAYTRAATRAVEALSLGEAMLPSHFVGMSQAIDSAIKRVDPLEGQRQGFDVAFGMAAVALDSHFNDINIKLGDLLSIEAHVHRCEECQDVFLFFHQLVEDTWSSKPEVVAPV